MAFIFTLLLSIFSIFAGLVTTNFQGAQEKGRDTVAKNDINSMYQKLEEFYNENGDYPTEKQLLEQGADLFPGIDPEALIDNNGAAIFERGGEYFYTPTECTAVGCQKYEL
jgi:type II secretory pathway pseudopilin PulG